MTKKEEIDAHICVFFVCKENRGFQKPHCCRTLGHTGMVMIKRYRRGSHLVKYKGQGSR